MSKNSNVNPDHYKLAGRDRTGNAVAKAPESAANQRSIRKEQERFEKRQQKKKRV